MIHSGTAIVQNTLNKVERNLISRIKKEVEILKVQICNREITNWRNNLPMLKNEVLMVFSRIAHEEFSSVFKEYYGNNYNEGSLFKSLSFFVDDNLQPHVLYNKAIFTEKTNRRARGFNKNVRNNDFDRNAEFHSLELLAEESQFFGFLEEDDDDLLSQSEYCDYVEQDNKVFSYKKPTLELGEIYLEAKLQTEERYLSEYDNKIKKSLMNQFSLKS